MYYGQPPPANNGQLYGGFQQQPNNFVMPAPYGAQQQQQQQQPAPAPQPTGEQTTRTTTIRNHVNLKKNTLAVTPVGPGKLKVTFTFDANVECSCSVFLVASENPKEGCRLTPHGDRPPPARTQHPRGLGQKFDSDAGVLDLTSVPEERLTSATPNAFPVIVRLECVTGVPGDSPPGTKLNDVALPHPAGTKLETWTQSQTTYATLNRKDDGGWGITPVKQKIWVDGVSYELQEIFGIENCGTAGMPGAEGGDDGKECVVCLSEPRDTTVLPCRHMCMCSGCARMLRHQNNKCPICRTVVESLLEIKVATKTEGA